MSSVILAGGPTLPRPVPTSTSTASAPRVIATAEGYLGVPYKWGGSSPATGFDCSGYVRYVYAEQGVQLPRTSREQASAGRAVAARASSLRQGDLMLFAEKKTISHVAIYAGGGRFIHSSSSGGGVRYDDLDTRRGQWFVKHMVAARRLAVDGRSIVQALDLLTKQNVPLDPPDHAPPPPR
jgi:cell wall-associated NlpC family hydrolase